MLVFLDEDHKLNTFASAIVGLWFGTIGLWVRANMMMQLARPPRPELTRATVRALPASPRSTMG